MAVSQLSQRTALTHMSELDAADDQQRLDRYRRAWCAYEGDAPLPFDGTGDGEECDNVRLDYAALIVDKGVSFLAGKGGVTLQVDAPDSELDAATGLAQAQAELAEALAEQAQAETEPAPVPEPVPAPPPATTPEEQAAQDAQAAHAAAQAAAQADAERQQQQRQQDAEKQVRDAKERLQEARARAALEQLDQAWPEEKRHLDFHQLALNGAVCGHFWLRLYDDGRVSVLDPGNVTAEWSEDDVEIVERYLLEWNTFDRETGEDVLRRKVFEPDDPEQPSRWTITDQEYDDETGTWRDMTEEPVPWDYPFAPLLGGQNLPLPNTFYGKSDLEPATLDMIAQMESVASDMRRIVRLHGHPVPVVIGESADNLHMLEVAVGELLAIPNDQAKLDQLTIAELTSSLALYAELKTALFETTRIPKVALGDTDNAGPVTGVALQVEYEPLIEKTETKRLTYGMVLRQAAERVLELRGLPGHRVTLGWPQLLPSDEATEAATAEADLRMGIVSKRTISEKRGYDWQVEEARLAEHQQQDEQSRAEALAQALGPSLHPQEPGAVPFGLQQ